MKTIQKMPFFFFFYWQSLDHILLDYLSEEYVPIIVFLFFFLILAVQAQ